MQAYVHRVTMVPTKMNDLIGVNLKARLSKMSICTVVSTDGWSAKDLKSMHLQIWDKLAELR